jgi:prepilin-type N-terminal cleavage/methylation domain-containing protein/prepilin-type processing-associated H-X9-DG protein
VRKGGNDQPIGSLHPAKNAKRSKRQSYHSLIEVDTKATIANMHLKREESRMRNRARPAERRLLQKLCRDFNCRKGFTFIELIVTLAVVAVLLALALPAWARQKVPVRTADCLANYRQWAVTANLYANDHQNKLPGFPDVGFEGWPIDVNVGIYPGLAPYGANVPIYYCPMRPWEYEQDTKWYGKPILTIADLAVLNGPDSQGLTYIDFHHNLWIYRGGSPSEAATLAPDPRNYGWPCTTTDLAASRVPFISDECFESQDSISTNIVKIDPTTAHFSDGQLLGVNMAFADGHVLSHSPAQVRAVYTAAGGPPVWFY